MASKKIPFIYRSFFNFWLAVLVPASLVVTFVFQLFKRDANWSELFQLPSTYAKILIFQLVFGAWMYYKEYKPKSAKFKENAQSESD